MKVHAAEASAERAALIPFQVAPTPDAEILGHAIPIITDDFERIVGRTDKTIDAEMLEDRQDVRRIQIEPFASTTKVREVLMDLLLQSHVIICTNPPQK